MDFIQHQVSHFLDVFVNAFYRVPSSHEVLIFVFSLLDALSNLLDIIALMLGFAHKHNAVFVKTIQDLKNAAVWPDSRVLDKQYLTEFGIDCRKPVIDFFLGNFPSMTELQPGMLRLSASAIFFMTSRIDRS